MDLLKFQEPKESGLAWQLLEQRPTGFKIHVTGIIGNREEAVRQIKWKATGRESS